MDKSHVVDLNHSADCPVVLIFVPRCSGFEQLADGIQRTIGSSCGYGTTVIEGMGRNLFHSGQGAVTRLDEELLVDRKAV